VTTVLLIHHDKMPLPHYRLENYRYLHSYLRRRGYDLHVCADGVPGESNSGTELSLTLAPLRLAVLVRRIRALNPRACILVVNHSRPYFFPLVLYARSRGVQLITWTHGTDLQRRSRISALVHHIEHELCDGIVLYADHMRRYLLARHSAKAFVANNTLSVTRRPHWARDRTAVLAKHGISTRRNVIFVGRVQARKRINELLAAFDRLTRPDCGLIIVGPDDEGILKAATNTRERVFPLGPLYGEDVLDLLSAADVYCIPGAIGLSIVDAMHCGLPVVTEQVAHGPEIMYLHEGENGFIVPEGDITELAERLRRLLDDDELRLRFSEKARLEIATRGHIDNLCFGVLGCLDYVTSRSPSRGGPARSCRTRGPVPHVTPRPAVDGPTEGMGHD